MFLPACTLMATGARTVLISRWRDGGSTTYKLMREFAQELPHVPAAQAWRRSVALAKDQSIDWELEPRVKRFETDDFPRADHPMFWAGYMLIDTGLAPVADRGAEALDGERLEPQAKR
jgi:CHAT domain-containing protein